MLPGGAVLTMCITILLNLVIITALFAMIFKLPDAKIAWSDVWIGALLTTVLFLIGKQALGLYLGSGSAGSAYGAASAMISTFVVGVLFVADFAVRRGVHAGLRQQIRLADRAGGTRRARAEKGNRDSG